MRYKWESLPKPLNVFTTRNTMMLNLNTREVIQHYSSNTRITLVQKCVTPDGTYYRTSSAEHHNLNWAFEAAAFGLPNVKLAPPVPPTNSKKEVKKTPPEKTKKEPEIIMAKGGEPKRSKFKQILKRVFGRS